MAQDWELLANAKREAILACIPKEWILEKIPTPEEQPNITGPYINQFLTAKEVEITETDAVDIVNKAASGTWTAVEITKAFCHKAAIAHQLLNCLAEVFFDAAIESARAVDEYLKKNKKTIGPLHGLPVSLKDQFHVKGVETTMGFVGWIGTFQGLKGTNKEKVYESLAVEELRSLGAILYCKTSVPMTLMSGETNNNIVGYTYNPKNRVLTAGGATGGEGALIGAKASPLGLGTDIAGSVRIPAAFNGIYGIRPSIGRLPYKGLANPLDGQNTVPAVVGSLSTSVGGLKLLTQALLSTKPWLHDPLVLEIPWRPEMEKFKKLTFGVIRDDGVVRPHPPVRRAVDMVAEIMQKLGHEVIEWKPTVTHAEIQKSVFKTWLYDGGKDARQKVGLSGEPFIPQVAFFKQETPEYTASEIFENNVVQRTLGERYMDYWNSTAELTKDSSVVDCIISPVAPFAAARRERYNYVGYTTWVNFLDYTSVVVPVTTASKNLDPTDHGYTPRNNDDKVAFESYDPEIYDGTPVGIQLVGRRLQEEKMLAIADYISKAIHSTI